ncbi:DUF3726 domain-containing protein [Ruegeria faecimaris]|uniref:DUF3726 domain-containing protein n=1 Tax=Ruegeria faecimaris TaxID=686389 RepID=UPI0023312DB5|nr:DUF3726 domain-containing protein [Ruegeria faecimaris]
MTYSLNEIEATSKRAARGAGYAWGLAEEAAKATRWLCGHGLDGTTELAHLLDLGLAAAPADHRPDAMQGPWQGKGALCPLATGTLLSDCAEQLRAGPVEMANIAIPALLLPFAAYAARELKGCVVLDCDGHLAACDGYSVSTPDTLPAQARRVVVSLGEQRTGPRPHQTRAAPTDQAWATLNRFAHRTYAPATEESRLLGAGAGLSDND